VSTQDEKGALSCIGYTTYEIFYEGKIMFGTLIRELNSPPIILQIDSDLQYSKGDGTINFSVLRPDENYDAGEFIPSNRP